MKEKKPVSEISELADMRYELKAMRGVLKHVKEMLKNLPPAPKPSCKTRGGEY